MKKVSISQMKSYAKELLIILTYPDVRSAIGNDCLVNYYQFIAHDQALNFPKRDVDWYITTKNYLSQFIK